MGEVGLVGFEIRWEKVGEEGLAWQRQHPWRSQQDFGILHPKLVLYYLSISELWLTGNHSRVWVGFLRIELIF